VLWLNCSLFQTHTEKTNVLVISLQLCLAYLGDISDHLKISYDFINPTSGSRSYIQRLQSVSVADFADVTEWTYVCLNLNALLSKRKALKILEYMKFFVGLSKKHLVILVSV